MSNKTTDTKADRKNDRRLGQGPAACDWEGTPFGPVVSRAIGGDQLAWAELVDRLGRVVWAQARRQGLNDDLSDEVWSRTWAKLVIHLSSIEDPEALPGWLATTARREVCDALRRKQRLVPTDDLGDEPDVAPVVVDAGLLDHELALAAREALGRLNPRDRELAQLRFLGVEPLSYAEIAERMDLPVGSIGPTIGRIVAKLRQDPALQAFADDHLDELDMAA